MIRLASQSSARRRMLEAAGIPFETVSAALDEDREKARLRQAGIGAAELAASLARAKALAAGGAGLIVGADQTLECDDGTLLDKPETLAQARRQLLSLSGRTHRLHSAAAVAEGGRIIWEAVETVSLTMRAFSDNFLEAYLDAEWAHIRWGVGGYRIEGPGVQLFSRIDGSHFAILGLPLLPLLDFLRERGAIPA